MRLNKETYKQLLVELEKTPIISEKEWNNLTSVVGHFLRLSKKNETFEDGIYSDKTFYWYSLANKKLNKILSDISNRNASDLLTIYTIDTYPPQKTKPHYDFSSDLTLTIILEDNFTGGDYIVNGKKIENMNHRGDYVTWSGKNDLHECEELISGFKKTLVVWYREKTELI